MRPSWFESRAYRQCFGISSFFPPVLNIALPLAGCTGAFVALGFVVVSGTSGVPGVALILACFGGASLSGMAHPCRAFGTPLVVCLAALFLQRWWFIFGTVWTCIGFGLSLYLLPFRHAFVMLLRLTSVVLFWLFWRPTSFDFVTSGHTFVLPSDFSVRNSFRVWTSTLLRCDFASLSQLCLRACGLCLRGKPYPSCWVSSCASTVNFLYYQFDWSLAMPFLTLRLTPTGVGWRSYISLYCSQEAANEVHKKAGNQTIFHGDSTKFC